MTKCPVLHFLLMVGGLFLLGFLTPWWTAAIWILLYTSLAGLILKKSILYGGMAVGVVWAIMSIYMLTQDDANIISKTGSLLGGLSSTMMILLTGFVGFMTGILSGWFGGQLGKTIRGKTKNQNLSQKKLL